MSDDAIKNYFCPKCKKIKSVDETNGGTFRIVDQDDWNFKVLEFRATMERRKKKEEFLMKYGPLIGLALVVVLAIVIAYFGYEFLDKQLSKQVAACQIWKPQNTPEATAPQNTIPIINNLMPNANQ